MRKKLIIGVIIIIILVGGLYIRSISEKKSNIPTVKTSTIIMGDVKSYLFTTAVVKSKNTKDYFGQQLKVNKLHVRVGDNVKSGDLLVSFDITDLNNNIKQTEIQYNNAILQRKELHNQRDQINKKIADLDKKIKEIEARSPQSAVEAAELKTLKNTRDNTQNISEEKIKQQENAVSLAKLAYDNAKAKIADGKESIKAEFDGVVTAVNVLEGSIGNPAQPAVTIQDINNLKAVVAIGKYDASRVNLGQPAEIKNDNNTFKGKVSFIDPVAKKTIGSSGAETTLNTEIDILDNPEGLKIDFDVDVNILLGERANVVKVLAEAVKSDKSSNNYVFVVENGRAVERPVKLGLQSDTDAEVLEGLKEGERVILNPVASIKTGTVVEEGK